MRQPCRCLRRSIPWVHNPERAVTNILEYLFPNFICTYTCMYLYMLLIIEIMLHTNFCIYRFIKKLFTEISERSTLIIMFKIFKMLLWFPLHLFELSRFRCKENDSFTLKVSSPYLINSAQRSDWPALIFLG